MKPTIAPFLFAGCAVAILAPAAAAQPGTRHAIVYGARAVGETDWHFGNLALQSASTGPLTFEVGVFFFRAQGHGLGQAIYKTYISFTGGFPSDDGAQLIEDVTNGTPPTGVDGRVSVYNTAPQVQGVFSKDWGPPQQDSRFRISSSADSGDVGAAGGVFVKQAGPVGNPSFHTGDGELGFRFNVTVGYTPDPRDILIDTPLNRINSFSTFNSSDSNSSTEFKASAVVDGITVHASWVPAPSPLALAVAAAMFAARRRR